MKKISLLIVSVLMIVALAAQGSWYYAAATAAGGAGDEEFSDNFDKANSDNIGAAWTEATGTFSIITNRLSVNTGSYAENIAAYTGTATDTVNQYVKITLPNGTGYPCVVFRYTNASSPMYKIFMWFENTVTFTRSATAADGSFETVQSVSATVESDDSWGWTCDGSGTNVTVRGWVNPTGNTPTSASNWGGDTTPTVTFTDNPTSPVDTGNYVGIGGEQNVGGSMTFNDFFGGDIP